MSSEEGECLEPYADERRGWWVSDPHTIAGCVKGLFDSSSRPINSFLCLYPLSFFFVLLLLFSLRPEQQIYTTQLIAERTMRHTLTEADSGLPPKCQHLTSQAIADTKPATDSPGSENLPTSSKVS